MNLLQKKLRELDACDDSMDFAEDKTPLEAWNTCPRGDWMLWIASKAGIDVRMLTLAKGKCAETVIHLMKDERSRKAVQAAIDFGNGLISPKELAAAAAYAAAYAAAAAAAAAYAAAAAADAAAAAAADAAAAAADAAADDAAAAYAAYAAAAARKENRLKTANICREIIPFEVVAKALNLLTA